MSKKEKVIQWLKDNGVFEKICQNSPNRELTLNRFLITEYIIWAGYHESDLWYEINRKYSEWYQKQFPDEFICVNFNEINN